MITGDARRQLAEALWKLAAGADAPPLSEASPASQRTCARDADALLPVVRRLAADELRETAGRLADCADLQHDDVRDLLLAVGLSPHARPYSPHEVVRRELLPALAALPLPQCPTHAVCPNCREGWGHWTGGRYMPTEQSRAANLTANGGAR